MRPCKMRWLRLIKNIQISKDELATALKELALVEAEAAYRGVALDKSSL